MKLSLRSAILVAGLAISSSLPAFADNLLQNGSFETGNFTGWTVSGNFIGVSSANGPGNFSAQDGAYYAYLGSTGADGTISQTFSNVAGQSYTLSYYLAGNGSAPSDFSAALNGIVFAGSILNPVPSQGYTLYSFNFTGSGSDTLTFSERNDPNYAALDNVSVSTNTSSVAATPEPSSLALLGTGVLGVIGAARRRLFA